MTTAFYQLIYTSRAGPSLTPQALAEILSASRVRNVRAQITGILVHSGGQFMQVLEGRREAVERLQERLAADPRHEDMRVVFEHEVSQRDFAEWDMALQELTPHELASGSALSQFFQPGFDISALRYGSPASFLLQAFRELHS